MVKPIKECSYEEFIKSKELNTDNSSYLVIEKGLKASEKYLKDNNIKSDSISNFMEQVFKGIVNNIDPTIANAIIDIDCEN